MAAPTMTMHTASMHSATGDEKKNDATSPAAARLGAAIRKYSFHIFFSPSKSYPTRELAIQLKTNTSVGWVNNIYISNCQTFCTWIFYLYETLLTSWSSKLRILGTARTSEESWRIDPWEWPEFQRKDSIRIRRKHLEIPEIKENFSDDMLTWDKMCLIRTRISTDRKTRAWIRWVGTIISHNPVKSLGKRECIVSKIKRKLCKSNDTISWNIWLVKSYKWARALDLNPCLSARDLDRVSRKPDDTLNIVFFFTTDSWSNHDDISTFWVADMDRKISECHTDTLREKSCDGIRVIIRIQSEGVMRIKIWEFIDENILFIMIARLHRASINLERRDENLSDNQDDDDNQGNITHKQKKLLYIPTLENNFFLSGVIFLLWFLDFFLIYKHRK